MKKIVSYKFGISETHRDLLFSSDMAIQKVIEIKFIYKNSKILIIFVGINCVNWCTNDASLILTGGRDDKIICWNYKTSEIVSETTNGENICNVKWSPKLPSIFSVTGQSGNVTINTLSSEEVTSYAPKWYKRPIFSNFGPNDMLLEFNEGKPSVINEFNVRKKEDELSKKLVEFEKR